LPDTHHQHDPLEAFIGVKVTAAEAWQVRRAAHQRHLTISDFVRRALRTAMREVDR
jgi:hypothetical protein